MFFKQVLNYTIKNKMQTVILTTFLIKSNNFNKIFSYALVQAVEPHSYVLKKSTNQSIKPHLFVHTKRRLAQLKFKKLSLLKEKP